MNSRQNNCNLLSSTNPQKHKDMLKNYLLPLLLVSLIVSACKKEAEDLNLDSETEALVSILQGEYVPVGFLFSQGTLTAVEVEALGNYVAWYNAFENYMEYFFIGSAYNNRPGDYYISFDPDLYDYLIYFDKSTASVLLN